MSGLTIRWGVSLRYAAFIQESIGVATIVASRLAADASGTIRGAVTIVTARDETFCDLEALNARPTRPGDVDPPTGAEESVDVAVATIGDGGGTCAYDESWLVVQFAAAAHGRWVRVGQSDLFVRTHDGVLTCLAFHRPKLDPDGALERAWLSDVGV